MDDNQQPKNPEAELTDAELEATTGGTEVYLKITLENAQVTSYSRASSGGDATPTESLSLNFDRANRRR